MHIAYIPDHTLVQLYINFTLPIFFWATFLDRAVNTKAPCRLEVVWVTCLFWNLQQKVPCRFREMWVVCNLLGIYRNLTESVMQTYNREICKCKPHTSDFFFFGGGEVKGIVLVFLHVRTSRYRTKVHPTASACQYSELGHKNHFEFT